MCSLLLLPKNPNIHFQSIPLAPTTAKKLDFRQRLLKKEIKHKQAIQSMSCIIPVSLWFWLFISVTIVLECCDSNKSVTSNVKGMGRYPVRSLPLGFYNTIHTVSILRGPLKRNPTISPVHKYTLFFYKNLFYQNHRGSDLVKYFVTKNGENLIYRNEEYLQMKVSLFWIRSTWPIKIKSCQKIFFSYFNLGI